MRRGRPRATYADEHLETARAEQGHWSVLFEPAPTANKVVRKLRREGLEAKLLVLDDDNAIVATRWREHADPEVAP